MTHQTTAEIREQLRGMALSLATGSGPIVEPAAFDAALDAYRSAVLREEADRIDATRTDFPIAVQNGITWATAEMRRHAAKLRRMADETATETPAPDQIRTVSNDCCGAEPPQDGTWGDCWCTLPPNHDGDHLCQPCTDRHGAPGWTDQPAAGARQDGTQP